METTAPAQRLLSGTDDALVRRAAQGNGAAFDALMAGRLDRCCWIDRETHLVMRLVTPIDPQSGASAEEVVELQLVDQAPGLFELPAGADVRP